MIVDVPFTFEIDFKSPGGRTWKRKQFRDAVPVEVSRAAPANIQRLRLIGVTDFVTHGDKLYERVPRAAGVSGAGKPIWTDPEWLSSNNSPVLPHDPLYPPRSIGEVPHISSLMSRETRPVDRTARMADAVTRAEELLLVGDVLYRHSAGPYLYATLDKPRDMQVTSLDPENPQTSAPTRFGALFSPTDVDLVQEIAGELGISIADRSTDLRSNLAGLSLRHGEPHLAAVAFNQALSYIDDMQARNVEPSLMLAIADYRDVPNPSLEQKRDLLSAFVAASKGIKDLKVADRLAYAMTLGRVERIAQLDLVPSLSPGTSMP